MTKTDLTQAQSGAVADLTNETFEATTFEAEDLAIPYVKLIQGMSPELSSFEDARLGGFWHTGADIDLGKPFTFVPLRFAKRVFLMAPMNDGQGLLARADDGRTWDQVGKWTIQLGTKSVQWEIKDRDVERSGLTRFGSSDPSDPNSKPAAVTAYEYLVYLPDRPEFSPVVLFLARSSVKYAKVGLNSKISMQERNMKRPMYALKFEADSAKEQNDAGQSFFTWRFRMAGLVSAEELDVTRGLAQAFSTYESKAAQEMERPETGSAADDPDCPF